LNLIGIFSAIAERTFWHSSFWIIICGGWVLSLSAALLGSYLGKKREKALAKV
jgi:hypothetical protein